jgi:ElaB/YqjD/DUF883 family membrane-anchored ribosome-binding protein
MTVIETVVSPRRSLLRVVVIRPSKCLRDGDLERFRWGFMQVGSDFLTNKEKYMSTTSERLGKQAMEVKKDLQEMGETVRDSAQEKLGNVGERASAYYEQGRNKAHGVACACEQFLRQRPLESVLIAAGAGWLVGRFWKRR